MKRGRKETRTYKELLEIRRKQKESGESLFHFATGILRLTVNQYLTLYGQLKRKGLVHPKKRVVATV